MKTQETFETYKLKMQQKLSDVESQIKNLKAKAHSATEEKEQQYQELISELEAKRDGMQAKLSELGDNSAEAFEQLKAGLESAWAELSAAVDKAKASF